ncbi:hypothetical protein [Fibrobacter sp.]|uniref:hypothetical protein n=1 Tax=Fibrobacter sp. TaxID=35828 RepID=UPI00386E9509
MSKILKLILLLSCALFAQLMPASTDDSFQEEDTEEVVAEHHHIYYDSGLFGLGKEYYVDGKTVELSEVTQLLLENEHSRSSAKVSSVLMGFAYVFGGVSGALLVYGLVQSQPYSKYMFIGSGISFSVGLVGAGVSSHYLDKAIDEYW